MGAADKKTWKESLLSKPLIFIHMQTETLKSESSLLTSMAVRNETLQSSTQLLRHSLSLASVLK